MKYIQTYGKSFNISSLWKINDNDTIIKLYYCHHFGNPNMFNWIKAYNVDKKYTYVMTKQTIRIFPYSKTRIKITKKFNNVEELFKEYPELMLM